MKEISWLHQYYTGLTEIPGNPAFNRWLSGLPALVEKTIVESRHGKLNDWHSTLKQLPYWQENIVHLDQIEVAVAPSTSVADQSNLMQQLHYFKPWRKGPFAVNDIVIDSEWRSDLKWDRLHNHVAPLSGRLVLDVGCGNGYHCWRMAGAGARAVIGIDPMLLYVMQYFVIQHFMRSTNVFVLPFTLESLPADMQAFDTVFSMGVLYHHRAPITHLTTLRSCLRADGELVLETLVLEGNAQQLLTPGSRYACMKNVWFIPSCDMLKIWLQRCGFQNIRVIDISKTTVAEQRATSWSGDASLADFLDPADSNKTIEGYPAPRRAIILASV